MSFAFDLDTEINKLKCTLANPANPANPASKVSNISKVSRGASSNHDFDLPDTPPSPGDLDALLATACQGVEGIDAAAFRALLSPVDVQDIEGGFIPMVTLRAYARSFAEGIRTGRITVLAAVIPKVMLTSRVRCADCRHFERDTVGDGNGIGWCRVQGEGTGLGQPALWPRVDRACRDFTERG
ncbi:MAG: hypothetical protein ACHBNF_09540 [Chromatiales bacterium]